MTRLRALFHSHVGELFVRAEELGALPNEPQARIALPGGEPPFVLAINRAGPVFERPFTGASFGTEEQKFLGVRIVQVIVTLDADLAAAISATRPAR
jgi:hypothetical protein